MKKPTIVAVVILSVLVMASTGCAKRQEAVELPIETTDASSIVADTVSVGEDESATPPPTDTKPATEEIISDAPKEAPDDEVEAENPYIGTYRNRVGDTVKVVMINDEFVQFSTSYGGGDYISSFPANNEWENDSILAYWSPDEPENDYGTEYVNLRFYPVGIEFLVWDFKENLQVATDDSRIRLYKGTHEVDINHDIFYKVEPLKEGELSYLPTPGFLHEFYYSGIFSGTGKTWDYASLIRYDETGNGEIKETMISLFYNGEAADVDKEFTYTYFEDSTGLYRREVKDNRIGNAELVMKYPIKLDEDPESDDSLARYKVVSVNETITTEAGVFENVVALHDGDNSTAYYAPHVGLVKHEGLRDFGELVRISK